MPPKNWIVKATGEREIFDPTKLADSLRRSGAEEENINIVVSQVVRELRDDMTTDRIYRRAFGLLKKQHRGVAAQYNLRRAVREMGPTGFPFEQYIGEMLKVKGYQVEVGVIVQGWCVEHEVDVSAKKDGMHILIECKFHNEEGFKTDLKVSLYVSERFHDIQKRHESAKDDSEKFHEAWLVTNTKLTSKAIEYANCSGLKIVSWNYPKVGNLQNLINETKLYPITALTTLSSADKRRLMDNDIVLFRDLSLKRNILHGIGIDEVKIEKVLVEVEALNKMTLS